MARTAVKLAVSLPQEDVEKMRTRQRTHKVPLSAIVREAVEEWLARKEQEEMEDLYRQYFADLKRRDTHRSLAKTMAATAARSWPED